MTKNMNSKMTTNSQLSINEPKKKEEEKQWKQKLSKQLEQEQNKKQEVKKKMRRGLGISRTTLNIPTSES